MLCYVTKCPLYCIVLYQLHYTLYESAHDRFICSHLPLVTVRNWCKTLELQSW